MKYCITMEKTQRISVWFEAANNNDAIKKGEKILQKHQDLDCGFDGGYVEYDYAIDDENDRSVITWS